MNCPGGNAGDSLQQSPGIFEHSYMSKSKKTVTPASAASTHVNPLLPVSPAQQKILDLKARLNAMIQAQAAEEIAKDTKHKALAEGLPVQFGVVSLAEVVSILKRIAKPAGSGKRGKVTPELTAKVIEMAKAQSTGEQIAAATGLSIPTVQKIKKANGLVRARVS